MDESDSKRRPPSPAPTCVSMKSDTSKDQIIFFEGGGSSSPQQMEESVSKRKPPSPALSCESMKSDMSKDQIIFFEGEGRSTPQQMEESVSERKPPSPAPSGVSMKSDMSKDQIIFFEGGGRSSPQPSGLQKRSYSAVVKKQQAVHSQPDGLQSPDFKKRSYSAVVKKQQGGTELSSLVVTAERWTLEEMQQIHKAQLQRKFQCLFEGSLDQGNCTSFNEVYTDLYIIEGGRVVLNEEHEVRQIERASWRKVDKPIKFNDIFKLGSGQDTPIRSVLTNGVAGIGKTVYVQKLILDWAEGKNNQHVNFIFPLPFRELNLMKERKFSLVGLIQHFFPKIKAEEIFTNSEHRLMFIFDGLDECRLPLQFNQSSTCCDVTEQVSVDVLLINLIQGNLLPSALLWITTRPAAASQIPQKYVHQVTEIRGFNDPQKEEYFGKRISDENLASKTITHLKSSRTLYIMCHIPLFCCIAATVVERTSEESDKADMPRTLTQMYIQFLIIQTSMKKYKYSHRENTEEEIIVKLGKLAFQQLEKGNLIFYEEDLQEAGIDMKEASLYSGVCTQIFREEMDVYQGRVFSFVHLTIQEFLAALYVFLCFSNREGNQQGKFQLSTLLSASTLHDLHKTAVDLALQSKNGHLDLFLRFLLGLSLESNQNLIKHLLPQKSSQSQSSEQILSYIKGKIRDESDSDRRINLFYCLNELNQHTLVEHIDKCATGALSVEMLLPGQQLTRTFRFEMSKDQLDEFDLSKYIQTPEKDQTELLSPDDVLHKLVPVVIKSTSAGLRNCYLTEKSCSYLAAVLTSQFSHLKHMYLGDNDLRDSGVELLCSGLKHPNCKLETLQLDRCKLTEKSCSYLKSALISDSCLQYLSLKFNGLKDTDVKQLSALEADHFYKLERLEWR